MGVPKSPSPAALFVAVLFTPAMPYDEVRAEVTREFGDILEASPVFPFNYSEYYRAEMGGNLQKVFFLLARLIDPAALVDWKLHAQEVEARYTANAQRQINFDPGCLDASKLVLATTKNYDHRIYLGRGIYGDVQLRYRLQKFHFNEWTYPDYRDPEHLTFFENARARYFDLLKTEFGAPDLPVPAVKLDYKAAGVDREKAKVLKNASAHWRGKHSMRMCCARSACLAASFNWPKKSIASRCWSVALMASARKSNLPASLGNIAASAWISCIIA